MPLASPSNGLIQQMMDSRSMQAPVTGVGRVWNPASQQPTNPNPPPATGTNTGAPLQPYTPKPSPLVSDSTNRGMTNPSAGVAELLIRHMVDMAYQQMMQQGGNNAPR